MNIAPCLVGRSIKWHMSAMWLHYYVSNGPFPRNETYKEDTNVSHRQRYVRNKKETDTFITEQFKYKVNVVIQSVISNILKSTHLSTYLKIRKNCYDSNEPNIHQSTNEMDVSN